MYVAKVKTCPVIQNGKSHSCNWNMACSELATASVISVIYRHSVREE